MGYHVIDPDEVDAMPDRPSTARSISDAAGLETLGLRVYVAAPGEQLPLAYHYHDEQEEAFYVIEGELHVRTPERTYRVGTGEVFLVEPGNPHLAHNPEGADAPVRVLAIGAPSKNDVHGYDPES